MGGGGKGGSQSQETKIPEWVKPYAEQNLRIGQADQQIGYMPYYGPDVAGFNEWDVAAAQAAREGAEAFGYAAPSEEAVTKMYPLGPQSSGELYDQAMAELRARRPGQMAYYDQFFVNPVTGMAPSTFAAAPQDQAIPFSGSGFDLQNIGWGDPLWAYYGGEGTMTQADLQRAAEQKGFNPGDYQLVGGIPYRRVARG